MFTKLEQRTWLKKNQCTRSHTARQCHEDLVKACRDESLPYRTVARWFKAYNMGRNRVEHMASPRRPSVSEDDMEAFSALLGIDRR
ncbi:hypothetical protein C0J52_07686 [Blattella germanica]|nr:hypothetical protein C0J52_07686 [Blattella germanica]